ERLRRKFGMTRAQFVRTAAAMAIGFWAIDVVRPGLFGSYGWAHNTATTNACDLEWDGKTGLQTLLNLPGEFIFDVQSHHVDPDGMWRVTNPAIHAFFAAVGPRSSAVTGGRPGIRRDGSIRGGGAGEVDPIESLSRFHYLKELFLDSATTMTVLSCLPTSPDTNNPLPLAEAALTVHTVNELAGTRRSVMHAFVMPNRGSAGNTTPHAKPLYLDQELELMMERAHSYRDILRGWKTYCPWGDVPYASGWFLDSETGMAFLDQVRKVSQAVPEVPPLVATHKGFALPGFDQRAATPRDIGPAARQFPEVNFLVYHSGHDIDQSAHLLGKLITFVGPKRVAWGTDSLWYGSPQAEIVGFRRFEFTERGKELYGLPHGLEGDVEDPTRKAPRPARTIRNAIL